jgi:hypothetical protein
MAKQNEIRGGNANEAQDRQRCHFRDLFAIESRARIPHHLSGLEGDSERVWEFVVGPSPRPSPGGRGSSLLLPVAAVVAPAAVAALFADALSGSGDLDVQSVGVGEVEPVALAPGLELCGIELFLGFVDVVAFDRVAIVVETGLLSLEESQAEVSAGAQKAVVFATVADHFQAEVLDVPVSREWYIADVQGDVIQAGGVKRAAFGRKCAGRAGHRGESRPEPRQSGYKLTA